MGATGINEVYTSPNLWLVLEQLNQAVAKDYVPKLGNFSEHSKIPRVGWTGALFCKTFQGECFLLSWYVMPSWFFLSDPGKQE